MRYYLDTEFNGMGGDLISVGLSPADPSHLPLYFVVKWERPTDPWVEKHVVPFLGPMEPLPRPMAASLLAAYLSEAEEPVLVADWPTDFSLLLDLLVTGPGVMVNAPEFTMDLIRLPRFRTADHSATPHNALADAEALRDFCEGIGKWKA